MVNYRLLNPHIEGNFKNLFSGKTPSIAAKDAWSSLSTHFTNNIPVFAFTLEKVNDNSLHHFRVEENKSGDTVNFSIHEHKMNLTPSQTQAFRDKIQSAKPLDGGKRKKKRYKDKDSDLFDDDDDFFDKIRYQKYLHQNQPISWWYYNPLIYDFLDSVYIPTFVVPLSPYVQISLDNFLLV